MLRNKYIALSETVLCISKYAIFTLESEALHYYLLCPYTTF